MKGLLAVSAVLVTVSMAAAAPPPIFVCCACISSLPSTASLCELLPEGDQDSFAVSCESGGGLQSTCIGLAPGATQGLNSITDCAELFATSLKPVFCPGSAPAAGVPLLGGRALVGLGVALLGVGAWLLRRRTGRA
jgi:hypothetical protein